jgi:hypothetical protein
VAFVSPSRRVGWPPTPTARKRRSLHEPGLLRGGSRRRAIALQRAKRIPSNTDQRTSIGFGSYIWNMQGGLLPWSPHPYGSWRAVFS